MRLTPLPGTREEVEGIARLFGKSATKRLGAAATEAAAKRESPQADIVHFACHGWLDGQMGMNSGLALSQPEALGWEAKGDDDGLLQAWEIFGQVKLKAELVVLSACQTGLGERMRGEGLIGMTRALQYAGARSVVASLWKIPDESTGQLMVEFYRQWRGGKSKDEALRQAQLKVMKDGKHSHPFYWAAFVLVGEWR